MIRRQSKDWDSFLLKSLEQLLNQPRLEFSQMTPNRLPKKGGVYLITKIESDDKISYHIGRTTNIQQRLHLMGPLENARLKKYLIDNEICSTKDEAKVFIQSHCAARWIEEGDYRRRKAIESFCTAVLFPEFGIEKEH